MEKILLGVILIAAVAVLLRMLWRSIAHASDTSKTPGCAGCPFDSKCQMQDRKHDDQCGDANDS
jgi:hypothetical protein